MTRPHTVAIVQARHGSSRLPGKVLTDIAGATMLARVIARVQASVCIDDVVVATTTATVDDAVALEAARCGARVVRGSELDVLARYLLAARTARAEAVVRVTADCPLLDPDVIEDVVAALTPAVDYASNTHRRTFPRGLDVEAMHRDTLERMGRMGTSAAAREHVTAFVLEAPALFRVCQVVAPEDDSDLRWTVDTLDDLAAIRAIHDVLDLGRTIAPYEDVVAAVRAHPELARANAHVAQMPSYWANRGANHVA